MLPIEINHSKCEMELDTGAAVSTISFAQFKKLCPRIPLTATATRLRTCTGEIIRPLGTANVQIKYKRQTARGNIFVLQNDVDTIFGRDWLRLINLDWGNIRQFQTDFTQDKYEDKLQHLLDEYKDVMSGELGEIPDYKYAYQLKEGSTNPIFLKPRQVPYAFKAKVEDEIARLEKLDIIEQVVHSPWGTPVVPIVKKDGSIRLCAAYNTTINKAIHDDCYPIPKIEDIFNKMNGGRYFCILDISNAYLHMKGTMPVQ